MVTLGTLRSWTCTLAAVGSAVASSVRYGNRLAISGREWTRYIKKSANFALCYVHLGARQDLREAWLAGNAAFVCCAYDVVTDWRGFAEADLKRFTWVLDSALSDRALRVVALDLYRKEQANSLIDDGLERGWIALRFTLRVMNCESQRQSDWGDINALGRMLQIVDDVLDYEDDVRRNEMNCLTSANRLMHLRSVIEGFNHDGIIRAFGPRRTILTLVLERATAKAAQLLSEWSTSGVPSPSDDLTIAEVFAKVP